MAVVFLDGTGFGFEVEVADESKVKFGPFEGDEDADEDFADSILSQDESPPPAAG